VKSLAGNGRPAKGKVPIKYESKNEKWSRRKRKALCQHEKKKMLFRHLNRGDNGR